MKEIPVASLSITFRRGDVIMEHAAGPPFDPWPGPTIGCSVLEE